MRIAGEFDYCWEMDSDGSMIHGHFLDGNQRDELERIVRRPSAVYGVARRANAILLLDDGLNFDQVAKTLYLDDSTIRDWHRLYLIAGFEGLSHLDWKGSNLVSVSSKSRSRSGSDSLLVDINGGARRNRTADLLNAIQALSQLSYGPCQAVSALRCC